MDRMVSLIMLLRHSAPYWFLCVSVATAHPPKTEKLQDGSFTNIQIHN